MAVPIYRLRLNPTGMRKAYNKIRKEKKWKAIHNGKFIPAYSMIFDRIAVLILRDGFKWRMPRKYGYLWVSVKADMNSNDPKEVQAALTVMNRFDTGVLWQLDPDARKMGHRVYYDNFHTNGVVFKPNFEREVTSSRRNIYKFKKAYLGRSIAAVCLNKDKPGLYKKVNAR